MGDALEPGPNNCPRVNALCAVESRLSVIFYPDNIILKRSDVLNTENSRKKGGENGVLRSRPFKEAWTVTIGLLLLCRHGIL